MTRLVDIARAIQERVIAKSEPKRVVQPAITVEVNGSVVPGNRPNAVWVSELNQPESRTIVSNTIGITEPGVPVLIGPDPKSPYGRSIISIYLGGVIELEQGDAGNWSLPPHAPNHQIPTNEGAGLDPVYIYQPALKPLKTNVDETMVVTVSALVYIHNGYRRVYLGETLDLTSYIPGAGLVRRVLLYLDPPLNSIQIILGSTVADNGVIPIPYPKIPADSIPSAYIRLANGQVGINWGDHEDARGFLRTELPLPTQAGQVMYSADGGTFGAFSPVTTDRGWLVNDSGQLIVL